jgi:hypothetical protein
MIERFQERTYRENIVRCLSSIGFLLFLSKTLSAQVIITSPVNNQVVQRGLTDSASIAITGYAYQPYRSIDIKLEPQSGNTAKATQQTVPEKQVSQGFFRTQIKTRTGWYRLSITATRTDGRQDTASISKVGIGEVFLIAGNSNAMGVQDLGAVSGSENVVSFDTVNKYLNNENITVAFDEPMRSAAFRQFASKNFAYPAGETSWLWGEFGDLLFKRYGTPVLFVNAGWAAASSINYREAASGKDTFNNYVGKNWPYRQPYSNIPNTLRYFNSWLGIRSVIWSHGENDAYHVKIDQASYFGNIQYLIQRTREDFGFNVPWVIGMSTVTRNENKPYPPVIQAQMALGKLKGFNTWLGPDTDTIQVPRPDHGHFENVKGGIQGLTLCAKAWNRSMPDTFFKSIAPIQPRAFIHTGVVPASAFQGSSFTLPFASTEISATPTYRAELIDQFGRFVVIVGTGNGSPLNINLPIGLLDGSYRIRVVGTNPILVGTTSELFEVNRKHITIGYIRRLTTEERDGKMEISWLMAANPGVRQITLQRSPDHHAYTDLKQFSAIENQTNSGVYAYTDHIEKTSVYYRIRMDYTNGQTAFSGALAIFRENGPPRFIVFPNPATDQYFFLRPERSGEVFTCSLFDVSGREYTLVADESQVIGLTIIRPVYALAAGMYILKIKTESGTSIQRVVFL